MNSPPLRRIKTVEPRSGYRVVIAWDHGPGSIVDLSHLVQKGGVFEPLRDERQFARVRVGERNRVIEWPTPSDDLGYPLIDIDAESLYALASQQKLSNYVHKLISAVRSIEKAKPTP